MCECLISVIVPIYNADKYLEDCLASIKNQTFKDFECIMIDDGSKDNSADIAKRYAEEDERFKYFYQENAGVSAARNYGLDVSKGKYVVFVDSDDMISFDCLKWLNSAKKNYPQSLPTVMWKRFKNSGGGLLSEESVPTVDTVHNTSYLDDIRGGCYSWGCLFERSIARKILFPIGMNNLEDVVFVSMYSVFVNSIVICNKPMYYYRLDFNSLSSIGMNDSIYKISCQTSAYNQLLEKSKRFVSNNTQKHILKHYIRRCINNIYGEAIYGKLKISDIIKISNNLKINIKYPTTIFSKYFGFLEYVLYVIAFKIKDIRVKK